MSKLLALWFLFLALEGWTQDPSILYLTWKGDPSTTMTVMWHTTTGNGPSTVYYMGSEDKDWKKQVGTENSIRRTSVTIHQAELTDLKEDEEYVFRLEDGAIHSFRTLPKKIDRPMKIAIGGDAFFDKQRFQKMNHEVASQNPDFVILAGDIAYTEGIRRALRTYVWKIQRWEEFFEMWSKDMITKEKRMIPIMPVIGNHDVREGFDNPFKNQVPFFEFFAFPKKGVVYQEMKVGNELLFFLLDSGHISPVGGRQTEWLEQSLKESDSFFSIPVYHIAGYPSVTSYTHRGAKDIRKFWVPLFEKYGIKVSMEHDNHAFKKTYPILEGEKNEKGIYYLGDGSWGVVPDKPHRHWYLEKTLQLNCYWLLTVDPSEYLFQAYDIDGKLLDELTISK